MGQNLCFDLTQGSCSVATVQIHTLCRGAGRSSLSAWGSALARALKVLMKSVWSSYISDSSPTCNRQQRSA